MEQVSHRQKRLLLTQRGNFVGEAGVLLNARFSSKIKTAAFVTPDPPPRYMPGHQGEKEVPAKEGVAGVIDYQMPVVGWLTWRWLSIPYEPPSGGEEKIVRKITYAYIIVLTSGALPFGHTKYMVYETRESRSRTKILYPFGRLRVSPHLRRCYRYIHRTQR